MSGQIRDYWSTKHPGRQCGRESNLLDMKIQGPDFLIHGLNMYSPVPERLLAQDLMGRWQGFPYAQTDWKVKFAPRD